MKISYNWLNDYLKIPVDLESNSEILTALGLEVEAVNEIFTHFDHLVVGKVIECVKHPNADRLKITQVDIGSNIKQIVCGATNIQKNQLVVVVLVGNSLVNQNGKSIKIKKTKIRGELSEGMICAEDEIGIGRNHDGIIVLPSSLKVGSLVSDYLNFKKDYCLDIGLTPNRTDAYSHIGVCRDLYAYFQHRGAEIALNIPSVTQYKNKSSLILNLDVHDVLNCPQYYGVCIQNVNIEPSPDWLRNKLLSVGIMPINNVVDITNFVLHESGNPLHAFDYDNISDSSIVVRKAQSGETFETLDSNKIELHDEDLVIADGKKVLCLAGVMGGLNSGVTSETKHIFLESAVFNETSVRKTSKRHMIQTDSSYRFERGVDFENCKFSLKRAAILIRDICGGTIGQESNFNSNKLKKKRLKLSFKNCNKILGHIISPKNILKILKSLDFDIVKTDKSGCDIIVPGYRADVYREIDVIEELLRIYGYDNIPASKCMNFQTINTNDSMCDRFKAKIAHMLIFNGFFEIKNNSLVPLSSTSLFQDVKQDHAVKILNPLSHELSMMRTNMFFSGLSSVKHNLNRQIHNLKLFEFGKVYGLLNNQYIETDKLTLFSCGVFQGNNWRSPARNTDFYLMKGIVSNILNQFAPKDFCFKIQETSHFYSDFGLSYCHNDLPVIEIGLFSSSLLSGMSIKKPVYYIDINLNRLQSIYITDNIKYESVPRFPSVRRDLSLLINRNISYSDIENSVRKINSKLLKDMILFDVYEGDKIKEYQKSYAISFVFSDKKTTLTDSDVDREILKIYNHLVDHFGVSLRDGVLNN